MVMSIKLKYLPTMFPPLIRLRNWPMFYFDMLGLVNHKEIVYHTWDGLKFCVRADTADRGALNAVAFIDEYRLKKMSLPSHATVIDIGGHAGFFSTFASRFAGKIYTYEPVPDNYRMLLKNIQVNRLKSKVFPHNMGVFSTKMEKMKIYISEGNTGGHSAYGEGEYIEVPTTTLIEILDSNHIERCDLLKMDVEGSEYEILYNLPDEYYKRIANIRMEVHPVDKKKKNYHALMSFLKSKGYTVEYKDQILFAERIS